MQDNTPTRISRVVEYISANLHLPPDYQKLAQLANLSYSQFFRAFKELFNLSPQQYIEQQRIESAQRLLAASRLSIKEITALIGFTNQLYFSRRFQKATGMSPTEYRANCLSDPEHALPLYSYYMGTAFFNRTFGSNS